MPKSVISKPVAPVNPFVKMEAPDIRDYSDGEPDVVIGKAGYTYNLRPGEDGYCNVPVDAVESAERIGWTKV